MVDHCVTYLFTNQRIFADIFPEQPYVVAVRLFTYGVTAVTRPRAKEHVAAAVCTRRQCHSPGELALAELRFTVFTRSQSASPLASAVFLRFAQGLHTLQVL